MNVSMTDEQIDYFLSRVYHEDRVQPCIDLVFDRMDDLLGRGDYETADRVLARLDIDMLPVVVLKAFLSIIRPALPGGNLPSAWKIVRRVRALAIPPT